MTVNVAIPMILVTKAEDVTNSGITSFSSAIIDARIATGILACKIPVARSSPMIPNGILNATAISGAATRRTTLTISTCAFKTGFPV